MRSNVGHLLWKNKSMTKDSSICGIKPCLLEMHHLRHKDDAHTQVHTQHNTAIGSCVTQILTASTHVHNTQDAHRLTSISTADEIFASSNYDNWLCVFVKQRMKNNTAFYEWIFLFCDVKLCTYSLLQFNMSLRQTVLLQLRRLNHIHEHLHAHTVNINSSAVARGL